MYLLDTNICIYAINKRSQSVVKKLKSLDPPVIKLSAIAIAELEYGAFKSNRQEASRAALHGFISPFDIIPFDDMDAEYFGQIRADLERRGLIIGVYDMQIAAQALRYNFTVVTNNTGEFKRVIGLKLEDWTID
jgi:tRNA(fMet)-specific endonuclease VapC